MYLANTVGAPLLICVISNSSKVLYYQAVLLWVPLNQKVRNLPIMCMIVRSQDRREMQVWTLNIFLLFHSRPFVTFKTLPGVSKYAVFIIIGLFCKLDRLIMAKRHQNIWWPFFMFDVDYLERETCVATKGQRQRTFDNST